MAHVPSRLSPGATLGRYRIERLIGRGGMGEVYEATQLDLSRRVALKLLRLPLSEKPELLGRFLQEGETAARMRHPHIVDVTDVGALDGEPYLVMELLDGEDLRSLLQRAGRLPEVALVDLLLPMLSAVCEVHRHGVVHRDLKPHNIFLCRTPQGALFPKLLDFGTAKVVEGLTEGDVTRTASIVGTPSYMAPEQITKAGVVDERTDQYSLGVVLFQAATGRLPFEQEELYPLLHAIVSGHPPTPRSLHPDLSGPFEEVILRAMARRRRDRYPSLRAMGRELLPLASPPVAALWAGFFHEDSAPLSPASEPALRHHTAPDLSGSVTLDPSGGQIVRPRAASPRPVPLALALGTLAAVGLFAALSLRSLASTRDVGPRAPASALASGWQREESAASVVAPGIPTWTTNGLPEPAASALAEGTRAERQPPAAASSWPVAPQATASAETRAARRGPVTAPVPPRAQAVSSGAAPIPLRGANGSPILD